MIFSSRVPLPLILIQTVLCEDGNYKYIGLGLWLVLVAEPMSLVLWRRESRG
jgi:hypothetical protein